MLSWYHGLKSFSIPGLFNLGAFEPLQYEYFEILIFVLMGNFGGIVGAIWNAANTRLTIFRTRSVIVYFIQKKKSYSKIIFLDILNRDGAK